MADLKFGGSDVKIMYGSQEIGGATKLEPGTILYMYATNVDGFENIHLFSTTKNWSNVDGIHIGVYKTYFVSPISEFDISGDDFKNLDIEKKYAISDRTITVSRSIVDGEYRLNVVTDGFYMFLITAL